MTDDIFPQYDCKDCYTFHLRTGKVYKDCKKLEQYEELGLNKDGICARIGLFKMNGVKPKELPRPRQPEEHYLKYFPFGREDEKTDRR